VPEILNDEHIQQLNQSGITDQALIERVGIFSADSNELTGLFQRRDITSGGLVFPYPHIEGFRRVRLDEPMIRAESNGYLPASAGPNEIKYLQKKGQSNHLYLALPDDELQSNSHLIITEGEKKSLALVQAGFPAVGLGGIWAWRTQDGPCVEFELLNLNNRRVSVIFDSDAAEVFYIRFALRCLVTELARRGATVTANVCIKEVKQ